MQEGGLHEHGMAVHNASTLIQATSFSSDSSLLNSKAIWGFTLVLAFVLSRVFGRRKNRPEDSWPLPALKGVSQVCPGEL